MQEKDRYCYHFIGNAVSGCGIFLFVCVGRCGVNFRCLWSIVGLLRNLDHRAVMAALSQSIVLIVTDKSVLVAVFAMIGFVILHAFQRKGAIYIYTYICFAIKWYDMYCLGYIFAGIRLWKVCQF